MLYYRTNCEPIYFCIQIIQPTSLFVVNINVTRFKVGDVFSKYLTLLSTRKKIRKSFIFKFHITKAYLFELFTQMHPY